MMVEAVFFDTSAFIALCSGRDDLHGRARDTLRMLAASRVRFLTSQWVLTELLNHVGAGPLRMPAVADVNRLLASPITEVAPVSEQSWHEAFDLYKARSDKGWSLVDCASILLCQRREVRRVFTSDRHFEQAGFESLLR